MKTYRDLLETFKRKDVNKHFSFRGTIQENKKGLLIVKAMLKSLLGQIITILEKEEYVLQPIQ